MSHRNAETEIFSRRRNDETDVAEVTSCGRAFHSRVAATHQTDCSVAGCLSGW